MTPSSDPKPTPDSDDRWLTGWPLLHGAVFAVLAFGVYHAALEGPFISDDVELILENPIVHDLGWVNLREMLDPWGSQIEFTATYAPVHMLATAVTRVVFGDAVIGYHAINILLHVLNSLLLVALLRASKIGAAAALLGGAVFLVHPALVEGVAWISQNKTTLAGSFAFGSLLLLRTRPGLATGLFVAALLTKPPAVFVLPTAAAFLWAWKADSEADSPGWGWLGVWTGCVALYVLAELPAYQEFSRFGAGASATADPLTQLRTMAAVGTRYLAMTFGVGLSAFHQPDPPSWSDPWWWLGLPLGAALLVRMGLAVRARRVEGAWWVSAAASFAPISQITPFVFPIADRYLYFILPGLVGGTLLALRPHAERVSQGLAPDRRRALALAATAAGLALVAGFAWQAGERARLWRNPMFLYLDSAAHYPNGSPGLMLEAQRAALRGDAVTAVAALERGQDKGISDFMSLASDPALAPIASSPEFVAMIEQMAARFIERWGNAPDAGQATLHLLAHAHMILGDEPAAADALEAAIAAGGPQDAVLRGELASLTTGNRSAPAR